MADGRTPISDRIKEAKAQLGIKEAQKVATEIVTKPVEPKAEPVKQFVQPTPEPDKPAQ